MCKFTYLGYANCDEPDRHYLIRREKCSAQANLKHWCPPQEQEESSASEEAGKFWVALPCPICADTPVVYDQPLLEIAHSRRSVLPAPHYDAVTGKYSRLAKHHAQYTHNKQNQQSTPVAGSGGSPENLIPKPLKMTRFQVERAASETAVHTIKNEELSPDYLLPATTYSPSPPGKDAPKMLPFPHPTPLTPPASRESSRSPPQNRIDASVRAIPPGESSRHELTSIRERAKAAAAVSRDNRPATPQSQHSASDRSRSGSESSSSSSAAPPVLPPLPPSRKTSNASSNASSYVIISSPPSKSGSETSRTADQRPPPMRRKESATRSPPQLQQQESVADTLVAAAVRPFERGRRPTRRDIGSGSERSNSPVVWRPTISHPTLQQDSLGIGAGSDIIVEPFKQRLVPFRPSKNGRSVARGQGLVESPSSRPRAPHQRAAAAAAAATEASNNNNNNNSSNTTTKTTALKLFPNPELDDKVAAEAFAKMFETEQKAHAYQAQAQAKAMAQAQAQTGRAMGLTQAEGTGVTTVVTSNGFGAAHPASKHSNNTKGAEGTHNNNGNDGDNGDGEDAHGTRTAPPPPPPPPPTAAPPSSKTTAVARRVDKLLPNVPLPTALRRVKTSQVKTVTIVAPGSRQPLKRSNTADVLTAPITTTTTITPRKRTRGGDSSSSSSSSASSSSSPPQISAPTNFVRVKAGEPLFSFAGKHGGQYAQEFDIITGPDGSLSTGPVLGKAF